ncbi:hypothetical protein PCASD_07639 [Puccinia coronata f. sp. avenae]|uniref:Uncharacterized protein n=1 Tax=Puccinia coronata f. sp. avenae TaxID=200324 RepID=A0A2N5UN40_9BASI|nr:hypothetical protein PCASD_07639 [Puccinia coronata f. sp. avenae]
MSWAVKMHNMLNTLASNINNLPPNSTEVITPTQLGTLDQCTGQQVLKFELYMQLADHNEMMRSWAGDVEWLWAKTRVVGSSHPWFRIIGYLNSTLNPATFIQAQLEIEEGAEETDKTLQEQEFMEAAEDGEFAEDSQVDQMLDEDGGWETDPAAE